MSLPLNQVLCGDCIEVMKTFPDETIDLVLTSPPYFNEKSYSSFETYEAYKDYLRERFYIVAKLLKNGCRLCVNVGDIHSKMGYHIPLQADIHFILNKILSIKFDTTIIWNKALKTAGMTNWGSWRLPSNPCVRTFHEYVLVYRKKGKRLIPSETIKKESLIPRNLFFRLTESVWTLPAVTMNKEHPAPFPTELVGNCVRLWSFVDDVVLDPFVGSGTTCVVAQKLGRRWIGIDINPEYVEMAKKRLRRECSQKLSKFLEVSN